MSVQRYRLGQYGDIVAKPDPDGPWVRWDDVEPLLARAEVDAFLGDSTRADRWRRVEALVDAGIVWRGLVADNIPGLVQSALEYLDALEAERVEYMGEET